MFSKASLLSVVLTALTVAATPALELKVSGPSEVTDVVDLKIVTTVTNTGDETLKLLKDPRGVLHEFPTESFAIRHDALGVSPAFIGARVKYVPSKVIEDDYPSSFTVLKPSEFIEITHDLSSAYDFSQSGTGKYTFVPSNSFFYVDPATSEATPIHASSTDAHQLTISGSLASYRGPSSDANQAFVGCNATQQNQVNAAIPVATNYVSNASAYINATQNGTTRYTTWFGTYTAARRGTVQSHFTNVNGNNFSSFTYDCSTCVTNPIYNTTFAYVYPNTFGKIYLCGQFWLANTSGTDSKGGTLVHEATHFTANGGTKDVVVNGSAVYGQAGCQALARTSPDLAVTNADSHEYFAENNPPLA